MRLRGHRIYRCFQEQERTHGCMFQEDHLSLELPSRVLRLLPIVGDLSYLLYRSLPTTAPLMPFPIFRLPFREPYRNVHLLIFIYSHCCSTVGIFQLLLLKLEFGNFIWHIIPIRPSIESSLILVIIICTYFLSIYSYISPGCPKTTAA